MSGRDHIYQIRKPNNQTKDFSVLLLSAGTGERFGGESKPMLGINNETLLGRQIRLIKNRYGENIDVRCVIGHKFEEVLDAHRGQCTFIINELYNKTNVTHSLFLGLASLNKPNVLVVYGDLAFDYDALPDVNNDSFLVIDDFNMENREIGVILDGDHISNMKYETKNKWSQMLFLTSKDSENLYEYSYNNPNHFLYEGINQLIDNGVKLQYRTCVGKIVEIDDPADYTKARKIFKK